MKKYSNRSVTEGCSFYGNFEADNKSFRLNTSTGYYDLTSGEHYQYLRNRQGSVMAVVDDKGATVQRTGLYPSGTPYILPCDYKSDGTNDMTPKTDRLHIGNHWMGYGGLNYYDNTARMHDPVLCEFKSVDEYAFKFPQNNHYVHCSSNFANKIDPLGLWDVTVHVYKDRSEYGYGVAVLTDHKGKELFRFDVRVEGKKETNHNRYLEYGDTPLGVYDIPDKLPWISGKSRVSYGPNHRLNMVGESGEIIETGRSLIRIHGGRQEVYNSKTGKWEENKNPILKRTEGCIRAYDKDIKKMKSITDELQSNDVNEIPGKVIVTDDLIKKEKTPTSDNTQYLVP
ncbi:MAG: hypothetical protein K2M07_03445 [Muribaculaceae bacterium]|nr:hypothetical protein [Muribaculaceae bacterium]